MIEETLVVDMVGIATIIGIDEITRNPATETIETTDMTDVVLKDPHRHAKR